MRFWCYSWRLPFSQVAEGNVVGRREQYRFSIPTLAIEFKSATVIMLVFHFNLIQFDEGVRPDEIISKFESRQACQEACAQKLDQSVF